jgi:PAS domain S-box-containing protein
MKDPRSGQETPEQTRLLLEAVLEQSPVAMVVLKLPDAVLLHINRAALVGLGIADEASPVGLSLSEIRRQQTWQDLTDSGGVPQSGGSAFGAALLGLSPGPVTFSVLRKEGTRRFFVGAGTPIRLADGTVSASLFIFRDITEEHERVEQLRQTLIEQQTILNTVSAGICLLKQRRFQWVNPAFESIFGYSAAEVRGQTPAHLYAHPEDDERVNREAYEHPNSETTYSTEVLLRRKSGEAFWGHIAGRAIQSDQLGERSIWVLQDIDSRKKAEKALLASQARLDAAQEQAHIGSWEIGLDDDQGGFWSKEMFRLFGMEPATSPPPFTEFAARVHPDDLKALLSVRETLIQTGTPQTIEYRCCPSPGESRTYRANFRLRRGEAGQVVGMAGTLQDVSEQKRTEREQARLQEQLQQAMKMEAVGRLAGGVAHDFNNLLTVISGNAELAKMELNQADPLRQYLDGVSGAAASAAELTGQLLAFSRRQIIEPRIVNLNDLVGSLRKMLARLIGENIGLETKLTSDLGAVKVDPGQFDQVIVNLAVNARDAMPKGGRLLIETSNREIDEGWCELHPGLKPGPFVMLAVTDSGHGMDKEVRDRIFEPFFTTKPKGHGTGLGLAMIFGVVHQAGGAIDVYSEVGQGTAFKIYLPRVDEPTEQLGRPVAMTELPKGNELVLLVEDEKAVRGLAATFLKRQGYRVFEAPNGGEALAYAERCKETIHLLFTDVVLPGMNGREVAERLHLMHPESAVLFASGYTEDTIVRTGVMSDQLAFISKPYSLQAVSRKVREVLDAHQRRQKPS